MTKCSYSLLQMYARKYVCTQLDMHAFMREGNMHSCKSVWFVCCIRLIKCVSLHRHTALTVSLCVSFVPLCMCVGWVWLG